MALTPRARKLTWVALAVGVPLLASVVLSVAWFAGAHHRDMSPAEREALLTAADLWALEGQGRAVDPAHEKATRTDQVDGTVDLTYEFESTSPPVYVATNVTLTENADRAREAYRGQATASSLGLTMAERHLALEDRPALYRWGDESRAALVTASGKPVGNFFIARKGSRVFLSLVTGAWFDDPQVVRALLEPRLEAMVALPR